MEQYYRHFRNRKIYRFVTFATLEATEEEAVVYQAMYGDRRIGFGQRRISLKKSYTTAKWSNGSSPSPRMKH